MIKSIVLFAVTFFCLLLMALSFAPLILEAKVEGVKK